MKNGTSLLLTASAALLSLALPPAASAQTVSPPVFLHKFSFVDANGNNSDGSAPRALVQGSDGTLYGTTIGAGRDGNGTLYKLATDGAFSVLQDFGANDAGFPSYDVLLGRDGNLYGTTLIGGVNNNGTVYQCTTAGVLAPLYNFSAISYSSAAPENSDGASSFLSLQGSDGNFYGTTTLGGAGGNGTIFRITPTGAFTTLHTFAASTPQDEALEGDGEKSLVQGSDGNLYGTTQLGGTNGSGTFFRLTPDRVLTTLYNFSPLVDDGSEDDPLTNSTGGYPSVRFQGKDGNFYGIARAGGSTGDGTVFKITPAGALTVLHTFTAAEGPATSLVQGSDGNLYGLAEGGGTNGTGAFFQLTLTGVMTTLYNFTADYRSPRSLFQGSDGSFYGVTDLQPFGDSGDNNGAVFRLTVTPPEHAAFFTGEVSLNNGVYYLSFPSGNPFGYYSYLADPHYVFHFDLGYEYIFDAADGKSGVYFYDFASSDYFYTSPTFPFPYLYDFNLNTVLYYYPDPDNAGHYNTDGVRYFYDFATGKIISK